MDTTIALKGESAPRRRNSLRSLPPGYTMYRDNASAILPVSVNPHSPSRDDQIRRVAVMLCPSLVHDEADLSLIKPNALNASSATSLSSGMTPSYSALSVKPLLGGLSNELFIVSRQDSQPFSVLVRIHPEGCFTDSHGPPAAPFDDSTNSTHSIVDRNIENKLVAWLSQQGMAPIFYGRFLNGRVEEFYRNVAPLSSAEMPLYGPRIAEAMADFHALQAPSDKVLPKLATCDIENIDDTDQPCRMVMVSQWFQAMEDDPYHTVDPDFVATLCNEWEWLQEQLDPKRPQRLLQQSKEGSGPSLTWAESRAMELIHEEVVTHMDCQSLNILKDASAPATVASPIRLIDFEYAGWNPRASDIANTFCEYCDMNNFAADYEQQFPSVNDQNSYLKAYVQRADPSFADELSAAGEEAWEQCLTVLRNEVGRFTLLSHLGWAVWAVLKHNEQGNISESEDDDDDDDDNSKNNDEAGGEFDYLKYARLRMEGYEYSRALYFSANC